MTDCDALTHAIKHHRYTKSLSETIVKAFHAGVDVDCGIVYGAANVAKVVQQELPEELVNRALKRSLSIIFRYASLHRKIVGVFCSLVSGLTFCIMISASVLPYIIKKVWL